VAQHLLEAFRPSAPRVPSQEARDLTLGQLRVLLMIRAGGPLSIGRIARSFGIGLAAASGLAERVEKHGLIERRHRTDDRRVVECHLTPAGRRLLASLAGMQQRAVRRSLEVLTDEELRDLDRLLAAIITRRGSTEGSR
jgi:DNA-binding MarR family transcriptional regulator